MKCKIIVLAAMILSAESIRSESLLGNLKYQAELLGGANATLIKSAVAKEVDKNSAAASAILFPTAQLRGWVAYREYAAGIAVSYLSVYRNQNNGADNSVLTGGALNFQFQYIPVELRVKYALGNIFADNIVLRYSSVQLSGGVGIPLSKGEVTKFSGQTSALKFTGVAPIVSLTFGYERQIWRGLYLIAEIQTSYLIDNGLDTNAAAAMLGASGALSASTFLIAPLVGMKYAF